MRVLSWTSIVCVTLGIQLSYGKRNSSRKKGGKPPSLSPVTQECDSEQVEVVSAIMSEHASLVDVLSSFCTVATEPPNQRSEGDVAAHNYFSKTFCTVIGVVNVHMGELSDINRARLQVSSEGRTDSELLAELFEVSGRLYAWVKHVDELVVRVSSAFKALQDIRAKLGRFHPLQKKIPAFLREIERTKSQWTALTKRVEANHSLILENLKNSGGTEKEAVEKTGKEEAKSATEDAKEPAPANEASDMKVFENFQTWQTDMVTQITKDVQMLVWVLSSFCASVQRPNNQELTQHIPFLLIKNGFCSLEVWFFGQAHLLSKVVLKHTGALIHPNLAIRIGEYSNDLVLWVNEFSKILAKSLPAVEKLKNYHTTVFHEEVASVLKVLPPLLERCKNFKFAVFGLHQKLFEAWEEHKAQLVEPTIYQSDHQSTINVEETVTKGEQASLSEQDSKDGATIPSDTNAGAEIKKAMETHASKPSKKKKKKAACAHQTHVDAVNDESECEQPDGIRIEGAQTQDSRRKTDEVVPEKTQVVESSEVEAKNPANEVVQTVESINSKESQVHASSSKQKKNKGKVTQVVVVEAKGDVLPGTTAPNKNGSEIAQSENQTEVDQSQSLEREQQNGDRIELAKNEAKAEESMEPSQRGDVSNSIESTEIVAVSESKTKGAWANIVLPPNWGVPGSWNREESSDEYSEDDAESTWTLRSDRLSWDEGSAAVENDLKKSPGGEREYYRSWVENSQRQDAEEWKVVDYHPLAKMAKKGNQKSQTYPNKK